ncbi:MAG: hypothetical protein ABIO70_30015 [Pseudomonadota bacterium]
MAAPSARRVALLLLLLNGLFALGIAERSHTLRSAWQAYEVRREAWLVLHAELLRRHGEEAME